MIAETLFDPSREDVRNAIEEHAYLDHILVEKVHQGDIVVLYFKHASEIQKDED